MRLGGANIEGNVGVPLPVTGAQVFDEGHLVDEPLQEYGECVSTFFGRGHYEDALLGVAVEEPQHVGCGNPGLRYATEPFDDSATGAMLQVQRYVVLYFCWFRKAEVLPYEEEEVAEVFTYRVSELYVYGHGCPM